MTFLTPYVRFCWNYVGEGFGSEAQSWDARSAWDVVAWSGDGRTRNEPQTVTSLRVRGE